MRPQQIIHMWLRWIWCTCESDSKDLQIFIIKPLISSRLGIYLSMCFRYWWTNKNRTNGRSPQLGAPMDFSESQWASESKRVSVQNCWYTMTQNQDLTWIVLSIILILSLFILWILVKRSKSVSIVISRISETHIS